MREVEVKARMRDRALVIKKLESLGCVLSTPVTQKDVIYTKNVGSLEAFNNNDEYLRIRVKGNGKIFFTLKKGVGNGLDKLEHETEVLNGPEMHEALLVMGYKEAVRVNKTRVTTAYNGCEICIDEVENLGSFIEVEKMVDDTNVDAEKIQTELFEFLKTLGIAVEDRVRVGYDILMLQK
jgi:adenylate cyclase, class 2